MTVAEEVIRRCDDSNRRDIEHAHEIQTMSLNSTAIFLS